jgi:hypothetical protein
VRERQEPQQPELELFVERELFEPQHPPRTFKSLASEQPEQLLFELEQQLRELWQLLFDIENTPMLLPLKLFKPYCAA